MVHCVFVFSRKGYLTFLSQIWPFCQNVIVQEVVTFISEWQVYYGSMTNSNYLYFWRSILSSWICFEKEQISHWQTFLAGKEIDCATIAFWFDLFSCEQLSDGLLSRLLLQIRTDGSILFSYSLFSDYCQMLIDRRQIEWPEKKLYLSHNMIRYLYLFSCGKFHQVYLYLSGQFDQVFVLRRTTFYVPVTSNSLFSVPAQENIQVVVEWSTTVFGILPFKMLCFFLSFYLSYEAQR